MSDGVVGSRSPRFAVAQSESGPDSYADDSVPFFHYVILLMAIIPQAKPNGTNPPCAASLALSKPCVSPPAPLPPPARAWLRSVCNAEQRISNPFEFIL